MRQITGLLERYANLEAPPGVSKKVLIEVIRSVTGILLTEREVRVRAKRAELFVHPVVRSELLQQKSDILTEARARGMKIAELH